MMKAIKLISIAGILLVVLLVCAAVALKIYFPPEKLKALVLKELTARAGRGIELEHASAGLFSGLRLVNLKISEAPDFSKGTWLEARELHVIPDLFALLKKQFIIYRLTIKGPRIVIIRKRDGLFNFSSLAAPGSGRLRRQETKKPPQKEDAPLPFIIGRARITGGLISYTDRISPGTVVTVHSLDLDAQGFSPAAPFRLRLSFSAKGSVQGIPADGSVRFEGTVFPASLQPDRAGLAIKALAVDVPGLRADLKGSIKNLAAPSCDLAIVFRQIDTEKLAPLIPLPGSLLIKGEPKGELAFKGALSDFTVSGSLDTGPAAIRVGKAFRKKQGDALVIEQSRIRWRGKALELAPLALSLDRAREEANGVFRDLGSGQASVKLTVSSQPLPLGRVVQLLPAAARMEARGEVECPGIRIDGPLDAPAVTGSVKVSNIQGKAGGLELDNISAAVDFSPDSIILGSLSGTLGASPLQLSGAVHNYRHEPDLTLEGSLGRLDLEKILQEAEEAKKTLPAARVATYAGPESQGREERKKAAPPVRKTSGSFTISTLVSPAFTAQDAALRWNFSDITAGLEELSGTTQLTISGGGQFRELDRMLQRSAVLKIVLFPVYLLQKIEKLNILKNTGLRLPRFSDISYKKITGDYSATNGLMNVKNFRCEGTNLDFDMRGTVHLAGETLDLTTTIRVLGGVIRGTLGRLLRDDAGLPVLTLKITGTLSDPKVRPDIIQTGTKVIEEVFRQLPGVLRKKK